MKAMKLHFILLAGLFITGIGSFSCGKSCGTFGWGLEIQDELNSLSAASAAYSQNPTPENCESYRKAYRDYIDALKGFDKCVEPGERDSWRDALDEAEAEADNIQC
jgi:hypothetical protein